MWNQTTYQSWRSGVSSSVVKAIPALPTPAHGLKLSEKNEREKEDEWLETWVANLQTSYLSPVHAWGLTTEGTSTEAMSNQFLESFKAVGFVEKNTDTVCSKSCSIGDLVTLKNISPSSHMIFYPARYTSRLIGKGGRNIENLKQTSSAKNIKISDGIIEIQGSDYVAQNVLAQVRKSLKSFASRDSYHNSTKVPSSSNKSMSNFVSFQPKLISTSRKIQTNRFQCLNEEDDDEEDKTSPQSIEEAEEAAYDSSVQVGCAWVIHRQKTIDMLTESTTSNKSTSTSPFTRQSQDALLSILSFFSPSEGISTVAALSCTDRKLSLYFLTCHHRVWKSLASRSWPQLGKLRTKQPLLYPLACAMHQHRIVYRDPQLKQVSISGNVGANKFQDISRVFHSIAFNSMCVKTMAQVYALELEYTINPRTGACDAAKVRGIMTFASFETLQSVASSSTSSTKSSTKSSNSANPTVLVPCYRGARQWRQLRSFAVQQLSSVGMLQRKTHHGKTNNGNETRLLAPLQPLLVAVKTYMVNSSDGVELDIDSFVALWRLLLALTDANDREGLARRQHVQHQLKAFQSNKFEPPDLGNFIASILIIDPTQWTPYLQMYLNKAMAKIVKWSCRELCLKKKEELIQFYQSEKAVSNASESDINEFLETCFQAGSVSRRSVLFWVSLKHAVSQSNFFGLTSSKLERDRAELVHGFLPTTFLKTILNDHLNSVHKIDTWEKLFAALGQGDAIPSSSSSSSSVSASSAQANSQVSRDDLLHILRMSWQDGIAKGFFTVETRFGELHASGGSNLFLIGNRFSKAAFMLDRSGSMKSPVGGYSSRGSYSSSSMSCLDAVKLHLLSLLEEKPVDFAFSVQLFDTSIVEFKNGELQQNTPAVRKQLKSFLASTRPGGGTDLVKAVEEVLKVKGAQECFLLTDGQGGGLETMKNLAKASYKNRNVPLHCIGIQGSSESLLKSLSVAGGGECLMVDAKVLAKVVPAA
jgi:hypothetical protein